MKEIRLTKGYVALVDDEDYDYLMQWKWKVQIGKRGYAYAQRNIQDKTGWHVVSMHRLLMKTPKGLDVDHIDHNGLNNQKKNLRNCTRAQNRHNSLVQQGECPYVGVTMAYNKNTFRARININGKEHCIGYFHSAIEAAMAYDKIAKETRGEFAYLNFPNQ